HPHAERVRSPPATFPHARTSTGHRAHRLPPIPGDAIAPRIPPAPLAPRAGVKENPDAPSPGLLAPPMAATRRSHDQISSAPVAPASPRMRPRADGSPPRRASGNKHIRGLARPNNDQSLLG